MYNFFKLQLQNSTRGTFQYYPGYSFYYQHNHDDEVGIQIALENRIDECYYYLKSLHLKTVEALNNDWVPSGQLLSLTIPKSIISDNELQSVYAQILTNFANPEARATIVADPRGWFEPYLNMFGNHLEELRPYAIIAEMLLLRDLLQHECVNDISNEWVGPKSNVHDFELPDISIEVKSTSKKHTAEDELVISSVHQLDRTNNKPLFLAFYQFEQALGGEYSLRSVYSELLEIAPQCKQYLDSMLTSLDYPPGCWYWDQEFTLLTPPRIYEVSDNFPKITPENFRNRVIPVKKLIYHISLANLQYLNINSFLNSL